MKDKFSILENAQDDILERMATAHPKPEQAYIDKIFAMTEQKLTENIASSEEFSRDAVIGVEHYRKGIGIRSAIAAAFAGIMIIGGAIGALKMMKNAKVVEPDPVIPPNIVTAIAVTTSSDNSIQTYTTAVNTSKQHNTAVTSNNSTAVSAVKGNSSNTTAVANANDNIVSPDKPNGTSSTGRRIVRVAPPTTTTVFATTPVATYAVGITTTKPADNSNAPIAGVAPEKQHVEMNKDTIGNVLNDYLILDNVVNKLNVSKSDTDIIEFSSFTYYRQDGSTYVPDHDGNTVFRYALVTDSTLGNLQEFSNFISNVAADKNTVFDRLSYRMPAPDFSNYTPDYEGPNGSVRIPELDEYFSETEHTEVNITFPLYMQYNGKLYASLDLSSNDDFICKGFDLKNLVTETRDNDPDTIYITCPYENGDPNLWYCSDFTFTCEMKHDTETDTWYVRNIKHSYREWYDFEDEQN